MVELTQGGGSAAGAAESARAVVDRLLPSVQTLLEVTRLARYPVHGLSVQYTLVCCTRLLKVDCRHICTRL